MATDKNYGLLKVGQGVWSERTTPLVPVFHYYWFIVDGVNVCDPAGDTFYGADPTAWRYNLNRFS
jgi:hypothetical protein